MATVDACVLCVHIVKLGEVMEIDSNLGSAAGAYSIYLLITTKLFWCINKISNIRKNKKQVLFWESGATSDLLK